MDSKTHTDRLNEELLEIFAECDNECEGGNYHHLIGLAESIFDEVWPYVPLGDRITVAKAISEKIKDSF